REVEVERLEGWARQAVPRRVAEGVEPWRRVRARVEPLVGVGILDRGIADEVGPDGAEGPRVGLVPADERRERESRAVVEDAAELPAPEQDVEEAGLVQPAAPDSPRQVPREAGAELVRLVPVRAPVVGGDVEAVLRPRRGEPDLALVALRDA